MADRFLVVVPTHRPLLAAATIEKIRQSFTYPTEFHVLDGTEGKVSALNKALTTVLDAAKHDIYVTIDDDILPPYNWQHDFACAFDRVPKLGVCGIDMVGSDEGENYMARAMLAPQYQIKDVVFRNTTHVQNVAGACMAIKTNIAKAIGPYPFINDGRTYYADEDGWRCHRCGQLGYQFGYVENKHGIVEFFGYHDSLEYIEKKAQDTANWQANPSWKNRKP